MEAQPLILILNENVSGDHLPVCMKMQGLSFLSTKCLRKLAWVRHTISTCNSSTVALSSSDSLGTLFKLFPLPKSFPITILKQVQGITRKISQIPCILHTSHNPPCHIHSVVFILASSLPILPTSFLNCNLHLLLPLSQNPLPKVTN